jgi:hypothetical protein
VILDILDSCWEAFQLWLASQAAIPCIDNDGPAPREGWRG